MKDSSGINKIFTLVKRLWLSKHLSQFAGIGLTLLYLLLFVLQQPFFFTLNQKWYDLFLLYSHNSSTSNQVVIVDIDEKSLEKFGQWPWPRYRVARLLEKINDSGVRAAALDILFAEPDRTSLRYIQNSMKQDMALDIDFSSINPDLQDNDLILAKTLKSGPFVLGYSFLFEGKQHNIDEKLPSIIPISVVTDSNQNILLNSQFNPTNVIPPLRNLALSASGNGFIDTVPEHDGILRNTPLVVAQNQKFYGSLALTTLWVAMNKPSIIVKVKNHRFQSLKIDHTVVPLDSNGRITIHFRGGGKIFPYISASDILNSKTPLASLKDKIILIGTSAAGLRDLRPTPLDPQFPGVEAQATIIDSIIQQDFIHRPNWVYGLEFCLIFITGLLTTFGTGYLSIRIMAPLTFCLTLLYTLGSFYLFHHIKFFISPMFPLITLLSTFTFISIYKYIISESDKKFIRSAFSKYVSKSVVDQIIDAREKLTLDGEEKEMTILFSDIRGFTSLSEQRSPNEVISILNEYLTPMTKVITDNHGTLDKYIGDAIIAFWNAPLNVAQHQSSALLSAIQMLEYMPLLNKDLKQKFNTTLSIGIGLHCGVVRVGNMGSENLFNYTVIGDNVNLTSRLEGLTKYYHLPLIFSDSLIQYLPQEYVAQELDKVIVKGRKEPCALYTLRKIDREGMIEHELKIYDKALTLYRNRQFIRARTIFLELTASSRHLHLYQIYLNRCQEFLTNPPPTDWIHVYNHTSKG